jgi:serine/threonine-protein kinase
MGVVFEAQQRDIDRRVALKLLHPEIAATEEYAQRFLTEARAANAAKHHHIVQITDFGRDGEWVYLVMEYLDGATLREWSLAQPLLHVGVILKALLPVGRALHYAHGRGFVHRDVKPENILIVQLAGVDEPLAKLIDFGIAKSNVSHERLTRSGTTLGTPMYMAPEQVGGAKHVTASADQYGLACVMYEALTQTAPFAARSLPQLMADKVGQRPKLAHQVSSRVSEELALVLDRALRIDPAERWPTLEDFCVALEPFASDERIPFVAAKVLGPPSLISPLTNIVTVDAKDSASESNPRELGATKASQITAATDTRDRQTVESIRPARLDLASSGEYRRSLRRVTPTMLAAIVALCVIVAFVIHHAVR